jgi:hypothetical protein
VFPPQQLGTLFSRGTHDRNDEGAARVGARQLPYFQPAIRVLAEGARGRDHLHFLHMLSPAKICKPPPALHMQSGRHHCPARPMHGEVSDAAVNGRSTASLQSRSNTTSAILSQRTSGRPLSWSSVPRTREACSSWATSPTAPTSGYFSACACAWSGCFASFAACSSSRTVRPCRLQPCTPVENSVRLAACGAV